MAFLTDTSHLNPSTGRCAVEHGKSHPKTFDFGAHLRLSAGTLAGESVLHLPVHSIASKRTKRIVQAGVSWLYPAFCAVTASGSIRRPAAGSFFCFGCHPATQQSRAEVPALRRLRLRFPSVTDPP